MYLPYSIVQIDGEKCVIISDQTLTTQELWCWMKEEREKESELYAELVHIYIVMKKGCKNEVYTR